MKHIIDFKKFGLIGLLLVFICACSTNPVTGNYELSKSEQWEIASGKKYHQEILKQYQVYQDAELQDYVNKIGQRLAAKSERSHLKFTFTVLDSPDVNAFALPGGYIYVTRGIMAYMTNEAQLAGVIGHEIGHVTARHGAQRARQQELAGIASAVVAIGTGNGELTQLSQYLGGALLSGYGRQQELQSDELGAKYIAQNNYDVDDMLDVIGILKNQELFAEQKAREQGRTPRAYHGLFSTHPDNDTRLKGAIKAAEKYRDTSQPTPDNGQFLTLTDGMAFGHSEQQGITRVNKFYHKELDLFVEFPQGWEIINQPSSLIALSASRDQMIQMKMQAKSSSDNVDSFLKSKFESIHQLKSFETQTGGLGYAGMVTLKHQNGQQQTVRAGALQHGKHTYLITGLGKTTLPDQQFFQVAKSIRSLKSKEHVLAKGRTIKVITAKRGDTFASLAKQSNLVSYAEDKLRLINGMYPSGEPTPGQKIKVIK